MGAYRSVVRAVGMNTKSDIEVRWIAIGLLDNVEIAVIYTMRGEAIRLITARRARQNERDAYHAHFGRRGQAP